MGEVGNRGNGEPGSSHSNDSSCEMGKVAHSLGPLTDSELRIMNREAMGDNSYTRLGSARHAFEA